MKITAIIFVFLLVTSSPLLANDAGVLIGIKSKNNQYRTVWVAKMKMQSPSVITRKNLFVPRDNGFWEVGVSRVQIDQMSYRDTVWATPANQADKFESLLSERKNVFLEKYTGWKCDSWNDEIKINFLSNNHVSLDHHTYLYCGGAHGSEANWLYVRSIDGLGMGSSIDGDRSKRLDIEMLGEKSRRQLIQAGRKHYRGLKEEQRLAFHEEPFTVAWGIERKAGRWRLIGRLEYEPQSARGSYSDFSVSNNPPRSITSHDKLVPAFSIIQRAFPEAKDALSSPNNELVIVVTDNKMILLDPNKLERKSQIGQVAIQKSDSIVMIQWATGRHVSRWEAQVKNLN